MQTVIVNEKIFLSRPEFWVKTMQEFYPEQTVNDMLVTIRNGSFYCFVFNDRGEVVSWSRTAKTYGRKTMYCLRQVETKKEERGKGYAGLNYKASEEYIAKKDNNAKTIYTFVDDDNESSIRLHEKLGYKQVEKPSKYLLEMHGWHTAIMFEKQIERENEKGQ